MRKGPPPLCARGRSESLFLSDGCVCVQFAQVDLTDLKAAEALSEDARTEAKDKLQGLQAQLSALMAVFA